MAAPNPFASSAADPYPDVSTVQTVDPSKTGAVTSKDGFLPTVRPDPTPGQPGFGVYAPVPANSTVINTPLSYADQVAQVDKLMSTLSSFADTFDFIALPPEVNAARLTFGLGNVPLNGSAAAYTAMAAALQTAAGVSDSSTDAMAIVWQGPSSERAQAAFRRHADWLRQQAEVAASSAQVATAASAAYMGAVGTMPPVAECLAAHAAVVSAETAAAASGGVVTPHLVAVETYYNVILRGRAAASMTTYSGAAQSIMAGLPTSTQPPPIASGGGAGGGGGTVPTMVPGGGVTGRSPAPPGDGSTAASAGSQSATSAASQAGGTAANQAGDAANALGQTAGQQLPDPLQGDSALQDALNPPGADQLPDYADYAQQHDPYGVAPYSSTLNGLYGGAGSMVAMSMVRGGVGTMSGGATGFRLPSNWTPRVARVFGALEEQTSSPMAGSGARRGASAPARQMRRDKDARRKKSGKVIAPGEEQDVPVLEDVPVIGVLEFAGEEIAEDVTEDLALSFGVLETTDDDAAPQYVAGDSHRD